MKPAAPMKELLVVGDCDLDYYYLLQQDYPPLGAKAMVAAAGCQVGGMGGNAACAAAAIAERVLIYTQMQAGSPQTAQLLADLQSYQVDTSLVLQDERPNTHTLIFRHPQGERSIFVAARTPLPLDPQLCQLLSGQPRAVYSLGSIFRRGLSPALAQVFQQYQLPLFLDFDAHVEAGDSHLLQLASLVSCNEFAEEQLWRLCGGLPAAAFFQRHSRLEALLVTRGARGGSCYHRSGHFHFSAPPVELCDSTGAGDAFNAVFYALWLQEKNPQQAVLWASAAAALTIECAGPKARLSHALIQQRAQRIALESGSTIPPQD